MARMKELVLSQVDPRYTSNGGLIRAVMQSPKVRAKLAEVADRKAVTARQIAAAEAPDVVIGRYDGTRPKGRSYARITAPADYEHGTANIARRRILGRAVAAR
jgi:hypothetical protein